MALKDLFDLTGKVALVTGGSRGLGLEMATALGEAGASVVNTARREQWLTPAEERLKAQGVNVLAAVCDDSNQDQVSAAVRAAVDRFRRRDILVYTGGIS